MSSTMHSLLIAKGGWAGYRVGGLGRGVGLIADSALYFWQALSLSFARFTDSAIAPPVLYSI